MIINLIIYAARKIDLNIPKFQQIWWDYRDFVYLE